MGQREVLEYLSGLRFKGINDYVSVKDIFKNSDTNFRAVTRSVQCAYVNGYLERKKVGLMFKYRIKLQLYKDEFLYNIILEK